MTNEKPVYGGRCLHYGKWIITWQHEEWLRLVKAPCLRCGWEGW